MKRAARAWLCGIAALLAAAAARAEPPAGLVMSITGGSEPPLAALDEIPANTPIRLGPATRLTFLHYGRCLRITATGGTLVLTRADYKADEAEILPQDDVTCPRVEVLASIGIEAGSGRSMSRGGLEPAPRWTGKLNIIFTGGAREQVKAAAVFADDKPDERLFQLDLAGSWAHMPANEVPLQPDKRYRLRLTLAGRREPTDVVFIAAAPSGAGPLIILRVE